MVLTKYDPGLQVAMTDSTACSAVLMYGSSLPVTSIPYAMRMISYPAMLARAPSAWPTPTRTCKDVLSQMVHERGRLVKQVAQELVRRFLLEAAEALHDLGPELVLKHLSPVPPSVVVPPEGDVPAKAASALVQLWCSN